MLVDFVTCVYWHWHIQQELELRLPNKETGQKLLWHLQVMIAGIDPFDNVTNVHR